MQIIIEEGTDKAIAQLRKELFTIRLPCKTERKIMHRRINITLPDETIELIDRVIEKGDSPEEMLRDSPE
ncbi:hypothetical protein [Nostoc sp. LPT]|uniref:hypothetical protein n=1 Tax=Nostoc sp. LPT TaxID=2815387 RepID=UPI0025E059FA|nr:hypothetical protein [Nostoc sp. LPT]